MQTWCQLALAGDFVPYAVNVSAAEASKTVRPYLSLGEQLGRMFAGLCGQISEGLEIRYQGQIAEFDTRILTLSLLKGFFGATTGSPVSYVQCATDCRRAGHRKSDIHDHSARDYVNLITVTRGGHSLSGTLVGLKSVQTLVMIDGYTIDVPPAEHLLVVRNADQPGMIGKVGTLVGEAAVNITDMAVGSSPEGEKAIMVLATTESVPESVLEALRQTDGVVSVATVG